MLNYETLLSSYDDKLTLMQWLKKVEEALKDASAVSFNVNKRGDATLTFSVVFEDGSEIETGPITLQQGESVQAATIRNGHLILTLTNGDELDAGDLGGVSSFTINASQHLIVTYQSGRTQDLGAIFSGNVVISGNFEVTGVATLPSIEGDENGEISVDGYIVISDGGISIADGAVSTPILTSQNDYIEAEKPVIEVMNGYLAFIYPTQGLNIQNIYTSIVKNGNKLTLVSCLNLTRTDTIQSMGNGLVAFYLPQAVIEKILPTDIGGLRAVDMSIKRAFSISDLSESKEITAYIEKPSLGTFILFNALRGSINQLLLDTTYYLRYEATFLLSDNLIN